MKRVLLIGGFPQDARRIGDDLRPYGVTIDWWWRTKAEGRGKMFPACDAVIVASKACSHALQNTTRADAVRAGVPLHVFSSKTRSIEHMKRSGFITEEEPVSASPTPPKPSLVPPPAPRPSSVAVQAALTVPVVAPPPPKALEPLPKVKEVVEPSKEDKLDEIIFDSHGKWSNLSEDVRKAVTKFLVAFDNNRATLIPSEVVKAFQTMRGNPRGFTAFVLHATREHNIMQNTAVLLHNQLYKRGLCASSDIPTRIVGLCGPDVGFRPADRSKLVPAKVKAVVEAPKPVKTKVEAPKPPTLPVPKQITQTPKETPVSNTVPPKSTPTVAMTTRFNQILMAAVESGEKITVQKAKNASAYAITYEDGVTVTLSAAT